MDGYEATRIVFSRIQRLDPHNAPKIIGLLLLQDHGEKEMIRLAFGPDTLVRSTIVKAKKELGLMNCSRHPYSSLHGLDELILPVNGGSTLNPASAPFYANGRPPVDDYQLHEHFTSLDSVSPGADFPGSEPARGGGFVSRGLGYEDPCLGFGWGAYPCKNGGNGKFIHGDDQRCSGVDGGASVVNNSQSRMEGMAMSKELIRSKAVPIPQSTRFAHQLMGGPCFHLSPKSVNLQQSEAQRAAAGEDMQKWGKHRAERNEVQGMGRPASRQIYLTFPADSTFREEDVSTYFSTYGAVEEVRIPYQQKRMFGFVTFVYSETVKSILAKGNPHFVCHSRLLVKPYKEKGRVPDKFSSSLAPSLLTHPFMGCPTSLDPVPGDAMHLHAGSRPRLHSSPHLLWRRRFDEDAVELQSTRLMNNSPPSTLAGMEVDKEKGAGREGREENNMNLPESLSDHSATAAEDSVSGSASQNEREQRANLYDMT